MPAPPATPYTVCPRASSAKACCCCCASPLGRYPVWTPTRPLLLVLYRTRPPSTVLWASPQLHPACWARHAAACLTPRSACLVVWRWARKRAKKGTYIGSVQPRVMYPYPASFAKLKHLEHPSQSLPRITHQVLWLFLGGRGRPHAVGMLLPRTHDR